MTRRRSTTRPKWRAHTLLAVQPVPVHFFSLRFFLSKAAAYAPLPVTIIPARSHTARSAPARVGEIICVLMPMLAPAKGEARVQHTRPLPECKPAAGAGRTKGRRAPRKDGRKDVDLGGSCRNLQLWSMPLAATPPCRGPLRPCKRRRARRSGASSCSCASFACSQRFRPHGLSCRGCGSARG